MKFGTFITARSGAGIAAQARNAEQFTFESAWVGEHMILPVNQASPYPYSADGRFLARADAPFNDPMMVLAYAAALTSKIRLATGVFVLPLRNPFATAKAVATLDNLSNGRVIFGVGIGWLKEEFEAVGMDFGNRALRTREALEMMFELWSKSDPVYEGKTVRVSGMKFAPKTIQQPHPPIVFGGTTEPALKRAARLGDGWYGIAHSLDETRSMIQRLHEFERAQNRTHPLEITISLRTGSPLTLDDVRRLADLGVERTLAGIPTHALNESEMSEFRNEIMDKM